MLCLTCRLGQQIKFETVDGTITIHIDRRTGGRSIRLVVDAPRSVAVTRVDTDGQVIAKPAHRKERRS